MTASGDAVGPSMAIRAAPLGSAGFLVGALALVCALRQISPEWSINPQYSYGWGVPILSLYLLWKRWADRPVPASPPARSYVPAAALFLALLWWPVRLIQEANPDWRFITWTVAMIGVLFPWLGMWWTGGRPWARHFAFPLLFILVAVPWPTFLEHAIIQSLMRGVAAITATGMTMLGLAATQSGNLIILENGVVGIDEACSGVRSVQVALMVTLFVGELCRLPLLRRLLLVGAGLAGASLLNLVRTSLLTWLCAVDGPEAQADWHDPAGYLMLGLTIALAWWMGTCLKAAHPRAPQPAAPAAIVSQPHPVGPRTLPWTWGLALMGWWILAEAGTEIWYRAHEDRSSDRTTWEMRWPQDDPGFRLKTLSETVRTILRCDESQAATWQRANGREWTVFFLKWLPSRMAAPLARGHTPDVCLPAAGYRMIGELGFTTMSAHGIELPFHTYAFERGGEVLYVFFSVTDDGEPFTPDQAARASAIYRQGLRRHQRMRAVMDGKRHRGQQILEVVLAGYPTQEQARAALEEELPNLISRIDS